MQIKLFLFRTLKISGSESFTRWLAPGSELGASWSEGSETNVILGFRVPTTIGLRKPPAGSPCSQLAPLAPRASLGPWSLWGGKGLWARWEQAEAGSPPSQHTPLAPAHSQLSPASQLTPSSLQPPSLLPSLQLAPSLLPALSSFPARSSLLLALSSLPPCSPCSSSLPACS